MIGKKEYDIKCDRNGKLSENLRALKNRLRKLNEDIIEQENLRKNCRDQISNELTYQNIFKSQL